MNEGSREDIGLYDYFIKLIIIIVYIIIYYYDFQ